MRNTSFNTHDIKRCCEKKLDIEFRAKKHFSGWFYLDGKAITRITVPKGRQFVPKKTYQSMAGQLKLNVSHFDDLLLCPLEKGGYEELLRNI